MVVVLCRVAFFQNIRTAEKREFSPTKLAMVVVPIRIVWSLAIGPMDKNGLDQVFFLPLASPITAWHFDIIHRCLGFVCSHHLREMAESFMAVLS